MSNLEFLTEAENKERDIIISDLNKAFQQRQLTYPELDDMSYDAWYIANKRAASGYMRPKKNREDIRIVTGTTREKCNTVVTALLRYNFEFNIAAFDEQDWPARDLGMGLEGFVRKTRKLEEPVYDEKRAEIYSEFVPQGNVFVYDTIVEEEVVRKTIKDRNFDDVFKVNWTEKKVIEKRCETVVLPGLNVYLGNIREKYINKQPFIGIRRELHKADAEAKYGKYRRWQQAEEARNKVLLDQGGQPYNNYQMMPAPADFKEEIIYLNIFTNTVQFMLDGVPMLPAGFPLEYSHGVRKYPIVKGDAEPISSNFAYCRGIASKNKFNQAMIDEMFRIIALKFRKSTTPPMANLSGKILNKSIFEPGTVHQGVDPEKLKPIGDNSPMTGPEFDTFSLIKNAIDESSVSPVLEGNTTPGQQTAQEIATLKTQSLQRLGMIMVGAIQMEEQLVWLRAYSVLTNLTDPIDTDLDEVKGQVKRIAKFRSASNQGVLENGQSGTQIVNMVGKGQVPHPNQIRAQEDLLTRKKGAPVRIIYIDATEAAMLKHKLYVTVTPTEKDHSELQSALFMEGISQAKTLFPGQVNDSYAKEEWANHKKLDPRKLWLPTPPPGAAMPGMPPMTPGQPGQPPQIPGPVKTVSAQAFPQTTQQNKPGLKRMM